MLGAFPLPIEVVPFGIEATRRAIAARRSVEPAAAATFASEAPQTAGHSPPTGATIFSMPSWPHRRSGGARAAALATIPGVVEHGLFLGLATGAVLATDDGLIEVGAV